MRPGKGGRRPFSSAGETPLDPETVTVPPEAYEKFLYDRPRADQNAQRGSVCPYCKNPLSPFTKLTDHDLMNGTFKVRKGSEICQPCYRYVEAEYYLTLGGGEQVETLQFEARMHAMRGMRRLALMARNKAKELGMEYIKSLEGSDSEGDGEATW